MYPPCGRSLRKSIRPMLLNDKKKCSPHGLLHWPQAPNKFCPVPNWAGQFVSYLVAHLRRQVFSWRDSLLSFCPLDREPPRIHTCPDDIYVFEDEVVTWEEPEYSDNVGVYYKKCNKENRDRTYPVGVYSITYTYVDFEYNYAICDFMINVTKRGKIVSKVICQIVTLLIIIQWPHTMKLKILYRYRSKWTPMHIVQSLFVQLLQIRSH